MGKQFILPHEAPDHWDKVLDVFKCHVKWSPMDLISAIDNIRKSSYKQIPNKEMPAEIRFSGLLGFLKDASCVGGNPNLFWGDCGFSDHTPDSFLKGWFLSHTVPFIVQLVTNMPQTFRSGLTKLNTSKDRIQERCLTKHQCASLLACSFFSAFLPLQIQKRQQ